jgi:hypothetical protein
MVVRALARGVKLGVGLITCGVDGVEVCAIVTDPPNPIKAVAAIISILAFIGILLFRFLPSE